jgi:hypothetical protein
MNTLGYEYELVLIRVLDFEYSEMKFTNGFKPENNLNYDWGFNTQFLVHSEQEVIFISLDFKLRHPGIEEHFASVVLAAGFKLSNYKEKLDEEGKLIVDRVFAASLLGVVYSTLRGIWHEKFRDTAVDLFNLPVIDPMTINYTVVYQTPTPLDAKETTAEA